jgi:hypothetical protein
MRTCTGSREIHARHPSTNSLDPMATGHSLGGAQKTLSPP